MPVQAATLPLIAAGRDLMVQSRTGSGKTAAFGIPFANGIVRPEDKFVQAIVLLPTRELALQVAAELAQDLRPPRRSPWCRSTAARRWAGRSSAARRRPDRLRHAGARARSPAARHAAARSRPLRGARRVRRDAVDGLPGGHRGDPREDAGRAADAAVLGDRPRGDPAPLAPLPAQPRVPQAVGRLHRRPRDQAPLLFDPGAFTARTSCCASWPSRSRSRRSSSATRARRPGGSPSSCASTATTPRRSRGICRRPIASA